MRDYKIAATIIYALRGMIITYALFFLLVILLGYSGLHPGEDLALTLFFPHAIIINSIPVSRISTFLMEMSAPLFGPNLFAIYGLVLGYGWSRWQCGRYARRIILIHSLLVCSAWLIINRL